MISYIYYKLSCQLYVWVGILVSVIMSPFVNFLVFSIIKVHAVSEDVHATG